MFNSMRSEVIDTVTKTHALVQEGLKSVLLAKGKENILFIGNIGAGKSSTINYLLGCDFIDDEKWESGIPGVICSNPIAKIGTRVGVGAAETLYPHIYLDPEMPELGYEDTPGFEGNRSKPHRMCESLTTNWSIELAKSCRIAVILDYTSFTASRAASFTQLMHTLSSLFRNPFNHPKSFYFIITKADNRYFTLTAEDQVKKLKSFFTCNLDSVELARKKIEKEADNILGVTGRGISKKKEYRLKALEKEDMDLKRMEDFLNFMLTVSSELFFVINVLDNKKNIRNIADKLKTLDPLFLTDFNFSNYDPVRSEYNAMIDGIVSNGVGEIESYFRVHYKYSHAALMRSQLEKKQEDYQKILNDAEKGITNPPILDNNDLIEEAKKNIKFNEDMISKHSANISGLGDKIIVLDNEFNVNSNNEKLKLLWKSPHYVEERTLAGRATLCYTVQDIVYKDVNNTIISQVKEDAKNGQCIHTNTYEASLKYGIYSVKYTSYSSYNGDVQVFLYCKECDTITNRNLRKNLQAEITENKEVLNLEKSKIKKCILEIEAEKKRIIDINEGVNTTIELYKSIYTQRLSNVNEELTKLRGLIKAQSTQLSSHYQGLIDDALVYESIFKIYSHPSLRYHDHGLMQVFLEKLTKFYQHLAKPLPNSILETNPDSDSSSASSENVESASKKAASSSRQNFKERSKERLVPHYFMDELSKELLNEPVILPNCGHTFSHDSLIQYLNKKRDTATKELPCPYTNCKNKITISGYVPTYNLLLNDAIKAWNSDSYSSTFDQDIKGLSIVELYAKQIDVSKKQREISAFLSAINAQIRLLIGKDNSALPTNASGLNQNNFSEVSSQANKSTRYYENSSFFTEIDSGNHENMEKIQRENEFEYNTNMTALHSQRSISYVLLENELTPSITVEIPADGDCGFTAIAYALRIQNEDELAEKTTRSGFIDTVKGIIEELRLVSSQTDRSIQLENLIKAIYEDERAGLQFDLSESSFNIWSNQAHFGSSSAWASECHLKLLSHEYNLCFEVYVIDCENNSRFVRRINGVIDLASSNNYTKTIKLLHCAVGIVNLNAFVEGNNHFDLLFFNPDENLKNQIRSKGYTITQDHTISSTKKTLIATGNQYFPGLDLQKIEGDCLYKAISFYLDSDDNFIRNMLATFLEHNRDDYRTLVEKFLPEGKSFEVYLDGIREERPGGDLELTLLMAQYDRPILVVYPDGSIEHSDVVDTYHGDPIFVYCNGYNHYHALVQNSNLSGREIFTQLKKLNELAIDDDNESVTSNNSVGMDSVLQPDEISQPQPRF